jgi:DNA-binding transcriptional MocR family regulator
VTRAADASTAGTASDVIDLARGHPSDDLLPLAALREAARTGLASDASRLQYGAERGSRAFRERLAELLGTVGGQEADPARLQVTSGASQALDLLCTLHARPGDVVLVEDPSYHLALRIFADHRLAVVGLEADAHGVRPDALASALARPDVAERARLLYLIPRFGNPTGASLDAGRATEVADIAARAGLTVVADEVYRLLGFAGEAPPSLATPERPHVLALQSFSKVLAPGLRLGWIEGDPARLDAVEASGLLQSGGGLAPLAEALVGELLASGEALRHLERLRSVYEARAAALTDALATELPEARFGRPAGGYFVWAHLPGLDADALLDVAEPAGVRFAPGRRFRPDGRPDDHLRLSFSHHPPERLREAVRRLAGAVASARALQSDRRDPVPRRAPGARPPKEEP